MIKLPRMVTCGLTLFAGSLALAGPAFACDDVSIDGCPSVDEVDDNAAALTGFWVQSKVKLLWYGDDYAVSPTTTSATPTATATFFSTVDTEVNGVYSVYARWTTDPNRCTQARYLVYDGATLRATVLVNQRQNGGAWRRLGTYRFTPDQTARVVLQNSSCPAGTWVVADGVRWVLEDNDHNAIVDEPGLDWVGVGSLGLASVAECGNPWTNLTSVSVSAPRSGYILVEASGIAVNTVASQWSRVGISNSSTGSSLQSLAPYFENEVGSTGSWENEDRYALRHVYQVGAGSHTYYLKACKSEFAGGNIQWNDFTAIYFPTRY